MPPALSTLHAAKIPVPKEKSPPTKHQAIWIKVLKCK
jgi:hypothetical protein